MCNILFCQIYPVVTSGRDHPRFFEKVRHENTDAYSESNLFSIEVQERLFILMKKFQISQWYDLYCSVLLMSGLLFGPALVVRPAKIINDLFKFSKPFFDLFNDFF